MYKIILVILLTMISIDTSGQSLEKNPVEVIITAGQSNTDGRIPNKDLPEYILNNANQKYKFCKISKGSTKEIIDGTFYPFWPSVNKKNSPNLWAYDAVTYYWLEQSLHKDFYVIKWSLGGTAIDTCAATNSNFYWQASPAWLAKTSSTMKGGSSLLLSFEENISICIDSTLSKLESGYEIKAFLWHQGESDFEQGEHYYANIKNLVGHVRDFLVKKTGNTKYAALPFICGSVSKSNKQYSRKVESALYQLSTEDPNFHVIDMSGGDLQEDELHFTKKSGEYLGIQVYNKMVELGIAGSSAIKVKID